MENEELEKTSEIEEIKPDREEKAGVNNRLSADFLRLVIRNRNTAVLNATVESYDPHNVALALEQCDPEDMVFFFRSVKSDNSAEVFSLLDQDDKERVVTAFSSNELQSLVDEMGTDDLVDFVDELPSNLVDKVLKATSAVDRSIVNNYLKFKDDSAGTLMTPEYLSVQDTSTVEEAIQKIRMFGKDKETVWEIFVVDNKRKLVGTITLDKLVEANSSDTMASIMKDDFVSVLASTDQEIVISAFRKYDISVLPVTNNEMRMLGIITFDDVIDVADEENTEDIQLTANVLPSEIPYLKRSVFNIFKSYTIWLLILLFLDTFISMTVSYLEAPLNTVPLLIAFLTAVMGTNSNAADQTGTVIIREIALGNVTPKNYWKVVWKEIKSGFCTGAILAVFSFGWTLMELFTGLVSLSNNDVSVVTNLYSGNYALFYVSIAAVISLTFLVAIIIAKWLGVTIPLLAKKFGIDPAVMSQPLISTILDVVSIIIYLLIAVAVMKGVGF